MNPRIKLLAEQAEGTKKHVPSVWQFYDHELEKFAQLIVYECVGICESVDEADIQYRYDYRRGVLDCADTLRQHFGVES